MEWTWFEKFLCKIGLHSTYNDTRGVNIGTEENPIYFMETITRCNRCLWQDPREN